MTAHALLLTGVPGVGKTTIVSKVAAGLSGRRNRGFVTDEIREGERRVGFEIRTFGGKTRTLAHVDLRWSPSGDHRECASFPSAWVSRFRSVPSGRMV